MNILIIFATIEGQTGKIARYVETLLQDADHQVTLVDAGDKAVSFSLDNVDKVILAGSVHERRHPKPFEVLIAANAKTLQAFETMMLSVSMSAAFPEGLDEAQDYVDEMKMRTGLVTKSDVLVAGAIRSREYDYYASQVLRHVVLHNRDFDPDTEEHEFTDWAQLDKAVSQFVSD